MPTWINRHQIHDYPDHFMEIKYINTDLDIRSKQAISKIIEAFGKKVWVLHHGKIKGYQHAVFEIRRGSGSADKTINYFCKLVEELPEEVRAIWDGCRSRTLDIGYESGTSLNYLGSEIKASTIQRVAGIGASILITIYPCSVEESVPEKT